MAQGGLIAAKAEAQRAENLGQAVKMWWAVSNWRHPKGHQGW